MKKKKAKGLHTYYNSKCSRTINILNMHPNKAKEFFKFKWNKPISGYRIIKKLCKLKCSGIKKMFKELPILECEDDYVKAMNYLILALTAYKATAEVIYDRLINVSIVCQIFKHIHKTQKYKELNWSHQAIFNLLRSAANMFLLETLGEFHELKSNMLDNEDYIISNIKEDNPEKKENKIINGNIEVEPVPGQNDSQDSLIKNTQITSSGKRKRRNIAQKD